MEKQDDRHDREFDHASFEDLPLLEDLSDEELTIAHLDGRPGAFEELYGRYERRLSRFIVRKTGSTSDRVQDLLQETFVRVARHLHRFDANRKFSTWVYTITGNLCKNELRNRSRSRLIPMRKLEKQNQDEDEGTTLQWEDVSMMPDRLYTQRHVKKLVYDAVDELPEHHQIVFRLRELEGKSYKEVARILGVNLGTVKSRLHRARTAFAREIEPHINPPAAS